MPTPTDDQVIHALARRMYESFCEHRAWTPHPYPYVDAGSIRNATLAVDMLGYSDDVLEEGVVA